MYSCNTESSSDLWNVSLEYSCKAGCQVWEGTAGISCTNTDESKKYWLFMVLVTQLKWVHIFRWATVLKIHPKLETNQAKETYPQSPIKTKHQPPSSYPSFSFLNYFLRDPVSCQEIQSHKVESVATEQRTGVGFKQIIANPSLFPYTGHANLQ